MSLMSRVLFFLFPDPLQADKPQLPPPLFPAGNTGKNLENSSPFLVLGHLFNPEFFQICSLPSTVSSLLLGAHLWAFSAIGKSGFALLCPPAALVVGAKFFKFRFP
ncbi:hypothetical protein SLEP1_g3701 [Rubroshorea leprosula]|uniref:Uncharacterized protein n=1 Tax=Rubroshorea leprosula TaxID=152421 RepID=A0AAV5HSR2_9ROSI|nr:hypothetical protein SLEP1_g3701 [Rubroshorea leprosula]